MQAALRSLEMMGIRVFLYRPCILRQLQRKSSISRLPTCADRLRCLLPRFPTSTGRSSNHKRIEFAEMAAEDMRSSASIRTPQWTLFPNIFHPCCNASAPNDKACQRTFYSEIRDIATQHCIPHMDYRPSHGECLSGCSLLPLSFQSQEPLGVSSTGFLFYLRFGVEPPFFLAAACSFSVHPLQ